MTFRGLVDCDQLELGSIISRNRGTYRMTMPSLCIIPPICLIGFVSESILNCF